MNRTNRLYRYNNLTLLRVRQGIGQLLLRKLSSTRLLQENFVMFNKNDAHSQEI